METTILTEKVTTLPKAAAATAPVLAKMILIRYNWPKFLISENETKPNVVTHQPKVRTIYLCSLTLDSEIDPQVIYQLKLGQVQAQTAQISVLRIEAAARA